VKQEDCSPRLTPGKNVRIYLKKNKQKLRWDMSPAVVHLPSKHKALSSKPCTKKEKNNKKNLTFHFTFTCFFVNALKLLI
jgi:hypothetical protein